MLNHKVHQGIRKGYKGNVMNVQICKCANEPSPGASLLNPLNLWNFWNIFSSKVSLYQSNSKNNVSGDVAFNNCAIELHTQCHRNIHTHRVFG